MKWLIEKYRVICDETNNSKEDLENGFLKADIFLPIMKYVIKFHVDKDGNIIYEKPDDKDM